MRFLLCLGVEPDRVEPGKPYHKPFAERSVRTLKHEWLDRFSLDTMADCYEALEAFPLKDLHDEQMSLFDYLKILQREAMSIAHYREMMWRQSSEVA